MDGESLVTEGRSRPSSPCVSERRLPKPARIAIAAIFTPLTLVLDLWGLRHWEFFPCTRNSWSWACSPSWRRKVTVNPSLVHELSLRNLFNGAVLTLVFTALALFVWKHAGISDRRIWLFGGGAVLGLLLLSGELLAERRWQRTRSIVLRLEYFVCFECGYWLVGLPLAGNCPECGSEYDENRLREAWAGVGVGSNSSKPNASR